MFFMLLGIDPEPWRPEDTLGLMRVLSYQMNHGGQHPAIRQLLASISRHTSNPRLLVIDGYIVTDCGASTVGEDDALRWSRTDLDPNTGEEWPPTRPNEPTRPAAADGPTANSTAGRSGVGPQVAIPEALLMATLAGQPEESELPTQGQGSNWWALSSDRTSTAGPLLANDPHLSVRVPCIWYESHLSAKDTGLHTTGVMVPGFPCTIIGHNEHVAVGVTLGYTDTEDLFVERFIGKKDPLLGHSTSYLHGGLVKEVSTRTEQISVKGQDEPVSTQVEQATRPSVACGF